MNTTIQLCKTPSLYEKWSCKKSVISLNQIFSRLMMLSLVFLGLFTKSLAQIATIQTNKQDYPPGATVKITGGGWTPGEQVTLQVTHVDGSHSSSPAHAPWDVSADINGNVSSSWTVPFSTTELNAELKLTATGHSSGLHAEAFFTDAVGPGTAPVIYPGGGFAIDGNLQGNTPTVGIGDWLSGPAGGGGNVLSASGIPLVPSVTFHLKDTFNSGTDDNFKGGMKVDDDPNDWDWVSNPVNDKQDINNGLVHIGTDLSGHIWLIVAADRLSPNGDAYIDFEFLQDSLKTTGTTSGGFISAGPDGGRTVNDFIITLELTNGGSAANFFFSRWKAKSGGGFDYFDETSSVPLGSTFAAVNTTSVPVSFGAFGKNTYDINTFAEAAVDLTALIGGLQSCLEIGVKTLMIKTKESQSPSATIVDFIKPIGVGFTVGAANAGDDVTVCAQGSSTSFSVTGFANPNPGDAIAKVEWSIVPGSGTATINSPNANTTTVDVTSDSVRLKFTVTTQKGCVVSDDVLLTVIQTVTCSITGDETVCPSSLNTYSGPPGATSYKWTITGDGTISGADDEQTVNVQSSAGCDGSYILKLVVSNEECKNTCSKTVSVKDETPPFIKCPDAVTVECTAPAPDVTKVEVSDNCTKVEDIKVEWLGDDVSGTCPKTITRTYKATDKCNNSSTCTQIITVNDVTDPTVSKNPGADKDLRCNPTDINSNFSAPEFTDNCDKDLTITSDDVNSADGCFKTRIRTWTATDNCGSKATASQKLTWKADLIPPVISGCPDDKTYQCYGDVPSSANVTAYDDCDGAIIPAYSQTQSKEGSSCNNVITRKWIFVDECGNASTCTQKITVDDDTKPTVKTPTGGAKDLGCNPTNINDNFLAPEFADNCDNELTITSDDANSTDGCIKTRIRTWTATDDCDNYKTASQKLTWKEDLVPPVISGCPDDKTYQCYADVPSPANVTAYDDCDGAITPAYSQTQSKEGSSCNNVITRKWIFVDKCGNASTCTQKITVDDDTKPTVKTPAGDNKDLDCNPKYINSNFSAPEFIDNCDPELTVTYDDVDGGEGCYKTRTRTWTATDDCGNYKTASQKLTWKEDLVPPVISGCPDDKTYQCYADVPSPANVTAYDDCDGAITPAYSQTQSKEGSSCNNVITRKWIFVDKCGNASTCIQKITVNDDTKPTVKTLPGDGKDLGCNPKYINNNFSAPEFIDNCDTELTIAYDDVDGGEGCYKTRTRTWTATDDCGNYKTASQKLTWKEDLVPPVLSGCPDNKTVECFTDVPDPAIVTALDNCDAAITPEYKQTFSNPGSTCYNLITRTWTATDACGNVASCTQTIIVTGEATPRVTKLPFAEKDLGCNPVDVNANFITPEFDHNCDKQLDISFVDLNSANGCLKTRVRTWTARDHCEHFITAVEKLTWKEDLVAPVLSNCPYDKTVKCYADVPAPVNVVALDNCDGAITPVYSQTQSKEGSSCNNVITRKWIFVDKCGNASTCTQKITVNDDTKPTVKTPPGADKDLGCNPKYINNNFYAPQFIDNCDKYLTVNYQDVDGGYGCIKTRIRTWTATDDCGNYVTASQKLTWKEDLVPPVLSGCPDNKTVECFTDVPDPAIVTALDNCDGAITPEYKQTFSNPGSTCYNLITRTWTATDACGNVASCTQAIIVTGEATPRVTKLPFAEKDLGCNPVDVNANFITPEFDHNCDKQLDISFVDLNSANGCLKTRVRTWTARDHCEHFITALEKLTWKEDVVAPVLSGCPYDKTVKCYADVPTPATITALDNCDGSLTPVYTQTQTKDGGSCSNVITRTWTVTDACGNKASCIQKITVNDETKPTVKTPPGADKDLGCNPKYINNNFYSPVFTDNCDKYLTVTKQDVDGGYGCIKTRTRTWTATDDCGNYVTATQKLTWKEDLIPPVLYSCPANKTVQCIDKCPAPATVTATDNCDGAITPVYTETQSNPGSSCYNVITRRWIATDACGNKATCTQKITVNDKTPPKIYCPADTTVASCKNTVYFKVTAKDNCGGTVTVVSVPASGSVFPVGTTVVTSTATDACGNTSTCTFKVTVAPPPVCTIAKLDSLPTCTSTGNKLCAKVTGGFGALIYKWTVSDPSWKITGGQGTTCIIYTAGGSGSSVTFTLTVKDAKGCKSICNVTINCANEGCTPGFWKNATTYWDYSSDPVSTCVAAAITSKGAPYSGNGTRTSSFRTTFGLTVAQMQAAGLNENLTLAQAIALGGGSYEKLARHSVAGLLSSCGLKLYTYTTGQVLQMTHDAIVNLAAEPTASKIAKANEEGNCPLRSDGNGGPYVNAFAPKTTSDLHGSIKAYPNPYRSEVNFQFKSATSGVAVLEVYDLLGQRLAVVFKGEVKAQVLNVAKFNVPVGNRVPIMYKLTIGSDRYHGTVIPEK